ncbi:MAG: hypothetical protein OEY64_08730 [Nitrospinota bacterium]|nr:hypothetical protein [Nitrospinota bacterium]
MVNEENLELPPAGITVEVAFPVDYRVLKGEEREDTIQSVQSHRTSDRLALPPPTEEYPSDLSKFRDFQDIPEPIRKMWLAIDQKLDSLIRHIGEKESALGGSMKGIISGISKMGAVLKCDADEGDYLHIRLSPPAYPPFTIDIVGKVSDARTDPAVPKGRKTCNLRFEALNVDDRELLISYIFKRQREILRGKHSDEAEE